MNDDDSDHLDGSVDATVSRPPRRAAVRESGSDVRSRQLDPGDVLGDRFTIIRFLARGGMGEVYEAADRHLQNKHCALKTLRSEIAGDASVRQRFEREVLLAREVTHPNVCPTFDLFRADGPRGPVLFLTMKLLRGESLGMRLKRAGAFTSEAALPIVRQMAHALDAAHRAGVIHRDFKPGNVMIEAAGGEPRVTVTDFGLSRAYEDDATLAETERVSGTLGYMAPELLHGGSATPASDVYALGVVVHEMLTGKRPVPKPGTAKFFPPSRLVPDLPRAWDRMVIGCLQADPAKRFQSAAEALSIADSGGASTRSARVRPPMSSQRRWLISGAVAAIVATAGWLAMPDIDTLLRPLPAHRFVALMAWPPDENLEYRPLIKTVLDTTSSRLARSEASVKDLLIISPADVAGQTSPMAPKDAVNALGANLVLAASIAPRAGGVALSLKVIDAATQRVIRERVVTAAESELNRLPERAAAAGARLLDVAPLARRAQDPDELANVPPAAYQQFAAAEDLASQPNDAGLEEAIERYQRALDIDPRFALAYARLSMAYTRTFTRTHDAALLTLASRNADLAMKYNPDSARTVLSRALVDVNSGRSQQALDEIGHALKIDPGNPQALIAKARTLRDLDRRAEEEEVYRAILKDRPNYWPAYVELGLALYRHGDTAKAAETFKEGSVVAPKVATLLTNLGTMYLVMDRTQEAVAALRRSLELSPTALAYSNLGSIAFAAGDYRQALDDYTRARDLRPTVHTMWRNIGDCYAMLGDTAQVAASYRKAAELLSAELAVNPRPGASWMSLAFYRAKLGERREAVEAMRNAEARGAGDLQSRFKRAQVLALLGEKEAALQQLLECLASGLSHTEVDLALDLKELRRDPRYVARVAQTKERK
jgi:eukaryotic-like serine/threonine-protein kinase